MSIRIALFTLLSLPCLTPIGATAQPAQLYWVERGDGVYRCDLPACTTASEVVDDTTVGDSILLDPAGNRLYYINLDTTSLANGISSTTLDGVGEVDHYRAIGVGGVSFTDMRLAPEGGGLYYGITGGPYRIRKLVIPGDTLEDVLFFIEGNGNQLPGGLDFDTGTTPARLYWRAAATPQQVWDGTPPISGLTTPTFTGADLEEPLRIDSGDDRVYYVDGDDIVRATLPGFTSPQTVTTAGAGIQDTLALDLDTRQVYWVDAATAGIYRAPMDPPFAAPALVRASDGALRGHLAILPAPPTPQVPHPPWLGVALVGALLAGSAGIRTSGRAASPRR